jgi:hypothetical protein
MSIQLIVEFTVVEVPGVRFRQLTLPLVPFGVAMTGAAV